MFLPLILSLLLLQEGVSDLDTDKQALLDFVVPHGLGWNPAHPICSSWAGVSCNSDRSRVVELRLSGLGLCGSIPANTSIIRLDALETLHLENNFLIGPIPSGLHRIPRLKSLNLSNNDFSGSVPPSLLKRFPPSSFGGNPSLTTSGLPPPEVAIPRLLSPPSSSWGLNNNNNKKKKPKETKSELWDNVAGRLLGVLAVLGIVVIFFLFGYEGMADEHREAVLNGRFQY